MSYRKPLFRNRRFVAVAVSPNPYPIAKKLRENEIAVVVQGPTFDPKAEKFGTNSIIKVQKEQADKAKVIIGTLFAEQV